MADYIIGRSNLANVFSLPTILSGVTIFSIAEIVLITILVTIFALLYNVVSALVGLRVVLPHYW